LRALKTGICAAAIRAPESVRLSATRRPVAKRGGAATAGGRLLEFDMQV